MYNNQSYFVNYRAVYYPTIVQGAGKILLAIEIRNILLTLEVKSGKWNNILFISVLYISGLLINLISSSKLLKKSYYLHCGNQTINSCATDTEIASASFQNRLFTLKLYKKPKKLPNIISTPFVKAAVSCIIILIQIWYKQ